MHINISGFTLGTTNDYVTYQWLRNGLVINGATNRYYDVTTNGDYQVVVTNEEGCIDTSDIYTVTNAGIGAIHNAGAIKVYPNPANNIVHIESPDRIDMVLTDITGKVIRRIGNARQFSVKDLASGLYLLRITDQDGTLIKVEKITKQD